MNPHKLFKQCLYAYPIPLAVGLVSLLAGGMLRGTWFGVEGPGWAVLALSLPWALARIYVLCYTGGIIENRHQRRVAGWIALGYTPVALACAATIAFALDFTRVLQIREHLLLLFFPFSLPGML